VLLAFPFKNGSGRIEFGKERLPLPYYALRITHHALPGKVTVPLSKQTQSHFNAAYLDKVTVPFNYSLRITHYELRI